MSEQPGDEAKELTMRHITKRFGALLIARRDAKAIERPSDGAWIPHRDGKKNSDPLIPFRLQDFREHMFGKQCLGTYLLDQDSMVRFMAFDIDVIKSGTYYPILLVDPGSYRAKDAPILDIANPGVGELEAALHDTENPAHPFVRILVRETALAVSKTVTELLGLPTLCVLTGGGCHVLVPFPELVPASLARQNARTVMEALDLHPLADKGENFWGEDESPVVVELFPKQDAIARDGFGNLIRLPLGWHSKAGRRSFFFDPVGTRDPWMIPRLDPTAALDAAAQALGLE